MSLAVALETHESLSIAEGGKPDRSALHVVHHCCLSSPCVEVKGRSGCFAGRFWYSPEVGVTIRLEASRDPVHRKLWLAVMCCQAFAVDFSFHLLPLPHPPTMVQQNLSSWLAPGPQLPSAFVALSASLVFHTWLHTPHGQASLLVHGPCGILQRRPMLCSAYCLCSGTSGLPWSLLFFCNVT